jgi:hypothetical protein
MLEKLLDAYAPSARKYLGIWDTGSPTASGEGLGSVIFAWCQAHPPWRFAFHSAAENGLTIVTREQPSASMTSDLGHLTSGTGPGSEFKQLLAELGIEPDASCDCELHVAQMNEWGIEGCRRHRDEIVGWLREACERLGWKERIAAAAKAVTSGLAFRLSPTDPIGSLVDEAIRGSSPFLLKADNQ